MMIFLVSLWLTLVFLLSLEINKIEVDYYYCDEISPSKKKDSLTFSV